MFGVGNLGRWFVGVGVLMETAGRRSVGPLPCFFRPCSSVFGHWFFGWFSFLFLAQTLTYGEAEAEVVVAVAGLVRVPGRGSDEPGVAVPAAPAADSPRAPNPRGSTQAAAEYIPHSSAHHSQTLPSMSWSPHGLASSCATAWVFRRCFPNTKQCRSAPPSLVHPSPPGTLAPLCLCRQLPANVAHIRINRVIHLGSEGPPPFGAAGVRVRRFSPPTANDH